MKSITTITSFIFFLLVINSIFSGVQAQNVPPLSDESTSENPKDTTATKKDKKTMIFNPGFTYISNLTYAGRKNTIGTPVLAPYFNLISTKGFFLSATGYLNTSKKAWSFDGAGITPGYIFNISKHFNGYLSATKYFFSDSSSLILASMKGTVDGGLNYTSELINIGVTFDYMLSKKSDFFAGVNISKDVTFQVFKAGEMKISPTAAFTAGTQSFYETYYKNIVTKKRVPNPDNNSNPLDGILGGSSSNPDSSTITSIFTEEQQKEIRSFNPLNLNFSIPVTLSYGKFILTMAPNVVFPFKQINPGKENASSELNDPFFFFSAGLSMILR